MGSATRFDLQLAHALQVDGRASLSRLATVLGVSDQTVARRYGRLRSTGALRVLGLTDPARVGQLEWYVRTRTTPEAAPALAAALARRSDTAWVSLLAGGTEVLFSARTGVDEQGQSLLLSALPRSSRVLDIRAHCLMHVFFGGPRNMVEKLGVLEPAQVAALAEGVPTASPAPTPFRLDAADRAVLAELAIDGRTSTAALAAATGLPASTVRRRVESLRASGVLYFDCDLDRRLLAREVFAVLWLTVAPADLAAAGALLAEHPEVAVAAACTGPSSLFAAVMTSDPGSLYHYLTTSAAALPGVREVECTPVVRLLKGTAAQTPS